MRRNLTAILLAMTLLLPAGCPPDGGDTNPNPPSRVVEYPMKYRTGDTPVDVAAEDVNGDGFPDYFSVNRAANTVSVILSEGPGAYAAHVDYPVGASPRWLDVADVSGDGTPDLLTADLEDDSVSILYGLGDGTFSNAVSLPLTAGAAPTVVLAADLNGDGIADITTANAGDGTVGIAPGAGGGLFNAVEYVAVGSLPRWLTAVSLDGDDTLELVVASRDAGDVAIVAHDGGAFGVRGHLSAGTAPRAVVTGDFNGDGHVDLAVTATASRDLHLLLGDGTGAFAPGTVVSFAWIPSRMTGGDFNADGNPDLAVLLYSTEESPNPLGVAAVMLGDGAGGFDAPRYIGVGYRSQAITTADENGDGYADLVCADGDGDALSVTRGRAEGDFAAERRYRVGSYPRVIAVGDLDGDSRPEVVVGHRDSKDILVLMNRGDGTLLTGVRLDTGDEPRDVQLAFFDEDTHLDMAVANRVTGTVSIFLGRGDGTFAAQQVYSLRQADLSGAGRPRSIAVGDLNGDGVLDIVAGHGNTDRIAVILGNGDGTFGEATETSFGNYPVSVRLARLDNDSRLDLVFISRNDPANPGDGGLPWLVRVLGNGDGTFDAESRRAYTLSNDPIRMTLGDVNGDGQTDAITAHYAGNVVDVMLGNSAGKFSRHTLRTGNGPESVTTADMDGNGAVDIITANKTETMSVLLNRGGADFNTHFELVGGTDGFAITATDLDGDGNTDLVMANRFTNDISVFMGTAGEAP